MTLRESGMPDQSYWESLFNPAHFLERLGFDDRLEDVAEFGCGYGSFALPMARTVRGWVHAIDADPEMTALVHDRAARAGLDNVRPLTRDLLAQGSGLAAESVDGVLIAHLLHGDVDENHTLLREAHWILRADGRLGVIHWRSDVETPRGPPLWMRLTPEQCGDECTSVGFDAGSGDIHWLGHYHWGLIARKPASHPSMDT